MEEVQGFLEAVSSDLAGVASGDAVIGTPVKLGAVTVYPISLVSVGMGGGGGEGEDVKDKKGGRRESGSGGGAGGGAKARPVAVLVFSAEGVSVLPVPSKKGKLDRIFEKIPEWVERFKERQGEKS